MRSIAVIAAGFVWLVLSLATQATAGEISCEAMAGPSAKKLGTGWHENSCVDAVYSGPIAPGDFELWMKFAERNYGKLPLIVSIYSTGGDFNEAERVGRLIRENSITVMSPGWIEPAKVGTFPASNGAELCAGPNCMCADACAVLWFGAVRRSGSVGLRGPRLTDAESSTLTHSDATVKLRRMLADMTKYLIEMNVPQSLIDKMSNENTSDLYWFEQFN